MAIPEGFDPGDPASGESMADRFLRYRRATRFLDTLVEEVLADLDNRGKLEQTVVVVTSDHGEEFGETEPGISGHGSAYTDYQLKVPLLILWPGMPPRVFDHRSSHYDIVPTLMSRLLECANPARDFAIGSDLFKGEDWAWLLAGSYYNYAVLEPDQVTITFPNGGFEIRDRRYRIAREPQIRTDVLQAVAEQNGRYFR
jgi:membrane-anchored protein YejM (alkaline phosphatase superfamily)